MNTLPATLFVEVTTRCNLSCPMCARTGPGWRGGSGDMDPALFERLAEAFASARAVILNGMGEPLLHPELPRLVRFVKERQPEDGWCGLQTNARLLTPELARALVRAGLDVVCISHDGEASLGHGGGGATAAAAHLLRSAGGRQLRLGLETVLMRGNVDELPALVDFAAGLNLDFLLATHLLPMDAGAEAQGLFEPCSAGALRFFEPYRRAAGERGLDLAQTARVAMKFKRSPAEEELLDLARDLRTEAARQGVWLNVGRLAGFDPEEFARLRALFAAAEARAAAHGLDLRLPALTAPDGDEARLCPFIERPAAFVDWRGQVSPCHFLWHGYACRVLGDDKRVHPQHFGSIATAPFADIWNGPDFVAFRAAAASGDYPPCGDCEVGMCSDANGVAGPFERDCLGVAVPCGHCPWSMGQLMCLGSVPL